MSDITWSFGGKVALVSGGASGIGRAAAAAWVAAGARVAVFDQSPERLDETAAALGREALATVVGDVSDAGDCERAVAETLARFGRLDILLNSAGTGAMGRVWDLDPIVWDRVLAVNLRGTFLLTRAASRWMVEQKRPGRIINIASTNATVPTAGHSPYCASKAGVVALTQVAALELAPHRVTVNAIAPGPVDTNLTAPLFSMPGAREEFLRHVPLGRMGRAEDIAQAILFLSSEAAEWVTGQCFYVDGGQSLVALPPYIDLVERLLGAKSSQSRRWLPKSTVLRCMPPSMPSASPVIEPAAGEARNAISAATSSGSTSRPAGSSASQRFITSAGIARTCSVATRPGRTALAVMPWRTFSAASVRIIPTTPAFVAV